MYNINRAPDEKRKGGSGILKLGIIFLMNIRYTKIGENKMECIKTKDRILLAALDLFSVKGYDQASIDLIAEAVGIKGPSIYAHYKGKEDILESLIAMMEQK